MCSFTPIMLLLSTRSLLASCWSSTSLLYWRLPIQLVFMSCSVMVSGFVLMFIVYLVLFNVVCFLRLGVRLCIVGLCNGCGGCCAFCLICDACRRCSWNGSSFV